MAANFSAGVSLHHLPFPHFGSSSLLASVLSGDFKLHWVKYLVDCLDSLEISLDVSNAPAVDLFAASSSVSSLSFLLGTCIASVVFFSLYYVDQQLEQRLIKRKGFGLWRII